MRSTCIRPSRHFFRFWLWLTTGMVTKEWTAIHRKHHAKVETEDDPHSPMTRGINTVVWSGAELYRAEARNAETMEHYGHGTPDDWIERNVYVPYSWQGVGLMLAIDLVLFGVVGATIWAVQMMWIPFWAAGIVNGVGHYWGYRNYASNDTSTNIVPMGHPDRRRGAAQQPPRLRLVGQVLGAVVRVRPGLALHPDAVGAGPRARAPRRAEAQVRAVETRSRPRDAAGDHHAPLPVAHELRPLAQGGVRRRARDAARARAGARGVELPSEGRLKRWLADPDALPTAERERLADPRR